VRDTEAWRAAHREPDADCTLPSGSLQAYCKRGWCRRVFYRFLRLLVCNPNCAIRRLEVLAALTPKQFWRGDWRLGPRNIRFRFHVSAFELLLRISFRPPRRGGIIKLPFYLTKNGGT